MGRPKAFDRDDALRAAMHQFWTKGYECSSIQMLLGAMKINRGSLYDTFGDKRSLFMEVLDLYGSYLDRLLEESIYKNEDPIKGLKLFMEGSSINLPRSLLARGCLLSSSISELAHTDPGLSDYAMRLISRVRDAICACIAKGQQEGTIIDHVSADVLADYVMSVMQGIRTQAKAGLSREELSKILDVSRDFLIREAVPQQQQPISAVG